MFLPLQAMSRRSVVVQGLRLGSGGPSFCTQQRSSRGPSSNTRRNNWNSSGGEGLREYSQSRGVAGGVAVPADSQSCDDARVFRETSFYDEDDTRDVLASSLALTSLSSLPEAPPESDLMSVDVAEQEKEHEHRHQQMNETKQYEERKKKDVAVLEPASSRAGLVGKVVRTGLPGGELPRRANETACVDGRRRRGEPSLSAERRASLASLAEDTYATFLADIIGEQLVQPHVISPFIFFLTFGSFHRNVMSPEQTSPRRARAAAHLRTSSPCTGHCLSSCFAPLASRTLWTLYATT